MSKVAKYLNQHISGEVLTNSRVRAVHATDGSILQLLPEMVAFPRKASDIRKLTRFSTQIAEKGHIMPVTVRGSGTDRTGGAIGRGVIVNTSKYMHKILEFDAKQKMVRLEPGVSVQSLNNTLRVHGLGVDALRWSEPHGTIGGMVASTLRGQNFVDQMEVVLASGDVMHIKKLGKRELTAKKGKQNAEGEIYRKLDALIDDNRELLATMAHKDDRYDHAGYGEIERVKAKDGSFDLRPLLCGSQGSLAVISELIVKADHVHQAPVIVVVGFKDNSRARDALDVIEAVQPTDIQYVSGEYLRVAAQAGKTIEHLDSLGSGLGEIDTMLVITINDFNARTRNRKLSRLQKKLAEYDAVIVHSNDKNQQELSAVHGITGWFLNTEENSLVAPPLFDGMFVPLSKFDSFAQGVERLTKKYNIALPLYGRPLDNLWYVRPQARLTTTKDKQTLFQLAHDLAQVVKKCGGSVFGAASEGRIHSPLSTSLLDKEVNDLHEQIKTIFDPYGLLNPGVKQVTSISDLTKQLRSDYHVSSAGHGIASY